MRRRIAAALFDCDGVLVNSEPIHWIAERESLRALGIVVTAAEQEGYVGLSQSELWERVKRKHGLALGAADLVSMHSDRLHRLMSQCPSCGRSGRIYRVLYQKTGANWGRDVVAPISFQGDDS